MRRALGVTAVLAFALGMVAMYLGLAFRAARMVGSSRWF
jgi:hypothetical protein